MFDSTPLTVVTLTSTVTALFATYYTLFASQKPKIYASNTKLKKFLDAHVRTLKEKYWPSPFLIEGRLQTIFGLSQRITTPSKLSYEREVFQLSDGGEIALDFMMVDPPKSERPLLVVILPGLTSSSQSSYIRTLVITLNQAGASTVVFNNRGNGGMPFKTPKTYSASYIGDLEEVIAHLKTKFSDCRMIGLGTSLGGMVLSKYLTTRQEDAKKTFECAILVSVAWDCVGGSENLEKPYINKYLINRGLAEGLVRLAKKFLKNFENVPLTFDPIPALRAKTVREFDAAVTAPQFGFSSVTEYYQHSSVSGTINQYSIPVFALSAEDDPIQPGYLLPTDEATAVNSKLALVVTSRGGHLGWLEGVGKKSHHFMERVLGELVQAIRINGSNDLAGI